MNVKAITQILSVFQDTKWQEPHSTKQLNFAKMHLDPICLRIFFSLLYYNRYKAREQNPKTNIQLERVLGEREAMSVQHILKHFCNPLSIC